MKSISRKEFLQLAGTGAAALLVPVCIGGLASCSDDDNGPSGPSGNVDFTLDVSAGALASNGGYLVNNGVIIARTSTGSFIAVSASCTHEGATIEYVANSNSFNCPRHGAQFSSSGAVTRGPANRSLTQFNTTLNGTTLRVFS